MTLTDFPTFPLLADDAPAEFTKALAVKDPRAFQAAFCKWVAKPKKRFEKTSGDIPLLSAVGWDAATAARDENRDADHVSQNLTTLLYDLLHATKKSARKKLVAELIDHVTTRFESTAEARICAVIVALELLLRHAETFDADVLVQTLVRMCQLDVKELASELPTTKDTDCLKVVAELELPAIMQLLLSPFQRASQTIDAAAEFSDLIERRSDTDGVPAGSIVQQDTRWIGLLSRISLWSKAFRAEWLTDDGAARWKDLSTCLAAGLSSRSFSEQATHSPVQLATCVDMLLADAGHSEKSVGRRLTTEMLQPQKASSKKKSAKKNGDSNAGKAERSHCHQSDWATNAIMRSGWRPSSDVLSLQWNEPQHDIALSASGCEVIRGPWATEVTCDGEVVASTEDWECTCWFEDNDIAFIELESELNGHVKHIRQAMLSLTDRFAVLLDSFIAENDDTALAVTASLPHAKWLNATAEEVTRDWKMRSDQLSVRAMPLWLPDDRVHSGDGNFSMAGQHLQMTATGQGGVTLPLFFDWGPERDMHDADWTRLTVTEERRIVSPREATGFRGRIGQLQIVLYRSFQSGQDLRAVLGQHPARETLVSRLHSSGTIEPLVMVDGVED